MSKILHTYFDVGFKFDNISQIFVIIVILLTISDCDHVVMICSPDSWWKSASSSPTSWASKSIAWPSPFLGSITARRHFPWVFPRSTSNPFHLHHIILFILIYPEIYGDTCLQMLRNQFLKKQLLWERGHDCSSKISEQQACVSTCVLTCVPSCPIIGFPSEQLVQLHTSAPFTVKQSIFH